MGKTRVLIIDDSALVRKMLTEIIDADPELEVVGAVPDPYVARRKIKELRPQVLTLDVEMPRMDGLTFLKNLMRLHPLPVVMVSSLTQKGAEVTLQALELGAIDFVAKPQAGIARQLGTYAQEITEKIKAAAGVPRQALEGAGAGGAAPSRAGPTAEPASRPFRTTDRVVAVGASTGGTEAIKAVLQAMPWDGPGMVVTQHIPESFSAPFATRMDRSSAMTVREAQDGDVVLPGHAFIAPGDRHLLLARDGARYVCRLSDGPPVNRHRPAVDVLFDSVAQNAGVNAVGVLLTGMGSDGAAGMERLRATGAPTIAQDQATSIVWGMPGEAVRRGAADFVLGLRHIAAKVIELSEAGAGGALEGA